jgi:hypothetical protein
MGAKLSTLPLGRGRNPARPAESAPQTKYIAGFTALMPPPPMPDRLAPAWLVQARRHLGAKFVAGSPARPLWAGVRANLMATLTGRPVPWSGSALAAWLEVAGQTAPRNWWSPSAWQSWGQRCEQLLGAIVVAKTAEETIIGLLMGVRTDGCLMVLWAADGGTVGPATLAPAQIKALRWPEGVAKGVAAPQF